MSGNDRNAVVSQLTAHIQHDLFIINHTSLVLLAPIVRRYKLPCFDAASVWLFEIASVRVPNWP